jgi:glycosyltransferase involved in cell wall biosynthesis
MDRICLVMIVKNESHVITRCLDSVLSLIDYCLICDTGSTDDTREKITNYFTEHQLPGRIIKKEWEDFGINRTFVTQEAQNTVPCEYILFIDADEVLVKKDFTPLTPADKENLIQFANNHPSTGLFRMMTHLQGSVYPRVQLVRNNQSYWWKYPYHEIIVNTEPCDITDFPFMINYARKEGGTSNDKSRLYWAIGKYMKWLQDDPTDSRVVFYLAQTYADAGDYTNAVLWYEKRHTMIGYFEESYISLLRLGRLYYHRGLKYKAMEKYVMATQKFPKRLEAFYELMILFDGLGMLYEAYSVGNRAPYGKNECRDENNILFIEANIYDWMHQFRLGVICWYIDRRVEGHNLIKDLLDNGQIPESKVNFAREQLELFKTD